MSGRAVVIGSSGGIGAALLALLREEGWDAHGLSRSAGSIDLTDESSIAAAAERIGGELDLVIVAAGILRAGAAQPEKSWRTIDPAGLAAYFAVNASGPALAAKHFLPLLARDRRAAFAALSARVGSITDNRLGGWYGYRASKAALNMLVRTLAIELARTRPQALCVALHPGTVDTGLSKPFQAGVEPGKLFTPAFAARKLLDVLAGLQPPDSGSCFAWDGSRIAP